MAQVTGDGSDPELDAALKRTQRLEEECRTLGEQVAQVRRELRFAKADIEVKDEYISSLEAQSELEAALVMLRTKTAYIESLPSVRFKAWLYRLRSQER
ncbi:MAG: hypothetical protein ACLQPH_02730 [Acidimicrobiales bacterium]